MKTEYTETPQRLTKPHTHASSTWSRTGGGGLVAGIFIGSLLMYLLDPRQGNRRRSVARDKVKSFTSRSAATAGKTLRHLRNKLEGAVANLTHTLKAEGATSDRKLGDRIRSTLGRTITQPHRVDLTVHGGRVTLHGDLKPHEAGAVVQAIEAIPGVVSIDDQTIPNSAERVDDNRATG